MGEQPNPKRPPSFVLAPISIEDQYKQPAAQQTTWWTRCTRWLHYYTIQIRWDIERWLARRFHRRWGS